LRMDYLLGWRPLHHRRHQHSYLRNTKAASVGRLWENATDAILGRRQKQAVPKSRKAMTADECHGAEASHRARPAQVPCAASPQERIVWPVPITTCPFSLRLKRPAVAGMRLAAPPARRHR